MKVESYEDVQATGLPAGTNVSVSREQKEAAQTWWENERANARREAEDDYGEDVRRYRRLISAVIRERHCSRAHAVRHLESHGAPPPEIHERSVMHWTTRAMLVALGKV